MSDLLPCPFCGSTDVHTSPNGENYAYVYCNTCGAEGPTNDIGSVVMTWNRRAQPAQAVQAVLIVQDGEICYKSKSDDQSYGMWCPVTPDAGHGLGNGTKLYAAHQQDAPVASWDDSRTQKVYEVLTNDNYPPKGSADHSEGWKARLVVDALFPAQPQGDAVPLLSDAELCAIGVAHGRATEVDGYEFNTLWFDGGDLRADYRAVEQAVRAKQAPPIPAKQIQKLRHLIDWTDSESYLTFARAIEAAHGIVGKEGA